MQNLAARKSALALRSATAAIFTALFVFSAYEVAKLHNLYSGVFRLSSSEVSQALRSVTSKCSRIKNCELKEGDILIRKYSTARTRVMESLTHPYFTHAAFYLGGDRIVEAVGTEKNSQDDVQVATLSSSDWFNADLDNFVILRPTHYGTHLQGIEKNFREIAADPSYTFGLPEAGSKKTTCADLIYSQLSIGNVITATDTPKIVTPDFLFSALIAAPADFEVAGFGPSLR